GRDRHEAIIVAIQKIGKAIIASGLTVIGGFSALIISDFVILSNFGIMTVINMTLCLVSTLIVLPPTLVLLDRLVKTKEVIYSS
ncbi:MAG: MMPL family transporter, partial [Bacilli bacterium]